MITKEQWELIKNKLTGIYGMVEFLLDGKKIMITRELVSENTLGLIVYIDGKFIVGWGYPGENYNVIVETLWNKKTRSKHTLKWKKEITKIYGKREAKKRFNLDEKYTWYIPLFSKYSVLERQYKKIKNLELVTKLDK